MKMHKLFPIALMVLFVLSGCGKDDETVTPSLEVSQTEVTIPADGTAQAVAVSTNQESWSASRPDADEWCTLAQDAGVLRIGATENREMTARTTEITVRGGVNLTRQIRVTQTAANAYVTVTGEGLAEGKLTVAEAQSEIDLAVETNNPEWAVSRPETDTWCTVTKSADNVLHVSVEAYMEDAERTTTVTVTGGAESYTFVVVQQGKAPVYSVTIPTDFSESYVQKVMVNGVKIAEICQEYIRTPLQSPTTEEQMVVVYPVVDGKTDLTKGVSVKDGGTIAWNFTDNTCVYTAGSETSALATIYVVDNNLVLSLEAGQTAMETTVEPELLVDTRPGDTKWSYKITKIGTQYWMAENLKATAYRDGSAISKRSVETWQDATSAAYCNPGDEEGFLYFGALYNGYTVENSENLAPAGWMVPSNTEWDMLLKYVASGKALKATGGVWTASNAVTNNKTGFSALPAGYCAGGSIGYAGDGTLAYFFSTTKERDILLRADVPCLFFANGNSAFKKTTNAFVFGASIRCVKQAVSGEE